MSVYIQKNRYLTIFFSDFIMILFYELLNAVFHAWEKSFGLKSNSLTFLFYLYHLIVVFIQHLYYTKICWKIIYESLLVNFMLFRNCLLSVKVDVHSYIIPRGHIFFIKSFVSIFFHFCVLLYYLFVFLYKSLWFSMSIYFEIY